MQSKGTFTNEIVGLINDITGKHNGETPTYNSLSDALLNKNPQYTLIPSGYTAALEAANSAKRQNAIVQAARSNALDKMDLEQGILPDYNLNGTYTPKSSDVTPSLVTSAVSGSALYGSNAFESGSENVFIPSVYYDAPYAQKYGMDVLTAYQEALSNTAHQREMADLKAAGLNPVLTANGSSGSSVFAGSVYAPADPVSANSSRSVSQQDEDSNKLDPKAIGNLVGGAVGIIAPRLSNGASKLATGIAQVAQTTSLSNIVNTVKSLF